MEVIRKRGLLVATPKGSSDYYRGSHGAWYIPPKYSGHMNLPILQFLWGQPWDEMALAFVHAVQPTRIRVTDGEETTDSSPGRVTVRLDSDDRITRIHQECSVGLPEGYKNGYEMSRLMHELIEIRKENYGTAD